MTLSMILVSALTCIAMDFLNGKFPLPGHAESQPIVQAEAR